MKSLSSIIITVISGVLVFIIGQILKEIWLTPLQEYKKLKSKISFSLSYYAQYYSNVVDTDTDYNNYKFFISIVVVYGDSKSIVLCII